MLDSQQVAEAIDGRLVEAQREIASLEAALAAMTGPSSLTSVPRPARRRRSRSRSRSRAAAVLSLDAVEGLLVDRDGVGSRQLADHAGAEQAVVLGRLRELEALGRVRRSGQRRGTRWHLVTDVDRVAVRAGELARRG
jgi:hypothetical protein